MNTNPFNSQTFTDVWTAHFNKNKKGLSFSFIDGVSFVKHSFLSYYINVGNKRTNGLDYRISTNCDTDYKGKVFLIRDIPSYFKMPAFKNRGSLRLKKIFQYQGYITKVSNFKSLEDYLYTIYKSNTRSKLKRNIKRLEACFDVEYTMHYGQISQEHFNFVFREFYGLLEKRYANKNEPCGELNQVVWDYYTELAFKMINEKTASLFVIYCDKKPIGITFSYHYGKTLIEALTVFDIDFYRFNIGHTTILKMLAWSFENNIEIFDYTQGDFEYKKRWSSDTYNTHYHLLYDSKSIKSALLASCISFFFNFKRVFRERKYNTLYHQFKYKLFKTNKPKPLVIKPLQVKKLETNKPDKSQLEKLDLEHSKHISVRRAIYDFLYKHPQKAKSIELYKGDNSETSFFAFGEKNTLIISNYES